MSLTFEKLHPLAQGLPQVVMLGSHDTPGAGGAMLELHTGLTAAGVNVSTLVMTKTTHRGGVKEINQAAKFFKIYKILSKARLNPYQNRPSFFELFSVDKSPVDLSRISELQQAGIVHLHWVAGMVGFPQAGKELRGKQVVWTLHDMNPLTGGCHSTAGCGRYAVGGCGACPQLGNPMDKSDVAAQNFAARQSGYADMNATVVSLTAWQAACARKSILLRDFPQAIIPNSVDPYIHTPLPRSWARAALGLPMDRKAIIFGAGDLGRWNKGLQILNLALEELRSLWRGSFPLLLFFGANGDPTGLPENYECISLGRLNPCELAKAYSAADVFISPSLQEAFGLVTAEAQACGTPEIGFLGTGAEDIIEDGVTGYLAAHPGLPLTEEGGLRDPDKFINRESVADLTLKIKKILELTPEENRSMRSRCREHALQKFSPVLQTGRYLQLYRRLLGLPEVIIEGLK